MNSECLEKEDYFGYMWLIFQYLGPDDQLHVLEKALIDIKLCWLIFVFSINLTKLNQPLRLLCIFSNFSEQIDELIYLISLC